MMNKEFYEEKERLSKKGIEVFNAIIHKDGEDVKEMIDELKVVTTKLERLCL